MIMPSGSACQDEQRPNPYRAVARAAELLGVSLAEFMRHEKKAHGQFPVGVCN